MWSGSITKAKTLWDRINHNFYVNALAACLLLYGSFTNVSYTANFYNDCRNPTGYKQELYKKHSIHVVGEINEEEYRKIDKMLDAYPREKKSIDLIEILSRDPKKLCLIDQISLFTKTEARTEGSKVSIFKDIPYFNYVHEIKHPLIRNIINEHPEFKEQWESLSKDDNGNSLYKPSMSKFLRSLLASAEGGGPTPELEKEGFLSDYAKTDLEEDIAITASDIDAGCLDSREIKKWFSDSSYWRLQGKIKMLSEYGLIRERLK